MGKIKQRKMVKLQILRSKWKKLFSRFVNDKFVELLSPASSLGRVLTQVENQSFISKEPAGMTLAPGSGEKGDVSSVLGSSDPVTRSPNTTGGSPHMTLASSLTKKWSEDP